MKSSTQGGDRASVVLDVQSHRCDRFKMRRGSQVHVVEFPCVTGAWQNEC